MENKKIKQKFVIGVDAGATKTVAVLADASGKIIARALAGAANPRNAGIKVAAKNIAEAIYSVIKGKRNINIASTFIGMPAVEEEYKKRKKEIIDELKKHKKISRIFKGKVILGSDQLVAFRSGADAKEGVVIIAGTGSVAHGWNNGQEIKVNGWGWLADEGSAFWIGQKTFQEVLKSHDGRGFDDVFEKSILKNLKLKTALDLVDFVYANPAKNIPELFPACIEAAKFGDKIARTILIDAGKEIALSGREVAAKLHFSGVVPLVLAGGVFNSQWVLDTVKSEINRYYPHRFEFIVVLDPIAGAVKLALENI